MSLGAIIGIITGIVLAFLCALSLCRIAAASDARIEAMREEEQ